MLGQPIYRGGEMEEIVVEAEAPSPTLPWWVPVAALAVFLLWPKMR